MWFPCCIVHALITLIAMNCCIGLVTAAFYSHGRAKAEEQAEIRGLTRQLWALARKGVEVQRYDHCSGLEKGTLNISKE